MKGGLPLRKPVVMPGFVLDTSTTNVTSSTYVQLGSKITIAASAVLVTNSGAQPLDLGVGATAVAAKSTGVIIPGASGGAGVRTVQLPAGSTLWVKSLDATQSSGIVTCELYDG